MSDSEIAASFYKQKVINLLNGDTIQDGYLSDHQKKKLNGWICQWFEMADDGSTKSELRKFDSFTEDEEEFKDMFSTYFASGLKNPEFGLFCFRFAFEFVVDQRKVARDIFENISDLKYGRALDMLDQSPLEWDTRQEAKIFFESALIPFAKSEEEKQSFWEWFAEEMSFDDDVQKEAGAEPEQKRNKISI